MERQAQIENSDSDSDVPLIRARSGPGSGLLSKFLFQEAQAADEEVSPNPNPFIDLTKPDEESILKTIQQNGETYFNGFDFVQRFQRWMYNLGLFNFNGFGAFR